MKKDDFTKKPAGVFEPNPREERSEISYDPTGSDEELVNLGAEEDDFLDPLNFSPLVSHLEELFHYADEQKYSDEQRMLDAYFAYRGIQAEEDQVNPNAQSNVFIRVTKTKVNAAHNQLVEVLFGNGKFPLTVDPTSLPEGVVDEAHINLDPAVASNPTIADAFDKSKQPRYRLKSTQTEITAEEVEAYKARYGPLDKYIELIEDQVKEGPGKTPKAVTLEPALIAAKHMEKKIHDQLEESNAVKHLRYTAFEACLFGTGIMKGPFTVDKEYPNWVFMDGEMEYEPIIKTRPMVQSVSVWDFYPDPEADNQDEMEYAFQRHKLSRTDLLKLKSRPFFREDTIDQLLEKGPNYIPKWWETQIEDRATEKGRDRWEVLEYWGFLPPDLLLDFDIKLPKHLKKHEYVSCNVWMSNGYVIRCVVNPFKPARIPYYAMPYELNPYSFFGVGVAENMSDTQTLMNGFMRLAVDNAAFSGNVILEVDTANLVAGQDLTLYPGKVFERVAGAPGQAIFATEFPNVSQQNMMMFDVARRLSDEATGLPSFAHGETGVQDTGRTASGISMLMEAANGTIRSVIKNADDYLIGPLGKALFAWNMQYDPDEDIKGDLDVNARGTESLMANAIRTQRLMQFLGIVQNPIAAPFAKMEYLLRETARSLDLDPDKATHNLQDAAVYAALLQKINPVASSQGSAPQQDEQGAPVPTSQKGQEPQQKSPAGVEPTNTRGTGGGAMGVGAGTPPGDPQSSQNKG